MNLEHGLRKFSPYRLRFKCHQSCQDEEVSIIGNQKEGILIQESDISLDIIEQLIENIIFRTLPFADSDYNVDSHS